MTDFYDIIEFNVDKKIKYIPRATQGDTDYRGFYIPVVINGNPLTDLTGYSLKFFAAKPDKTSLVTEAVIDGDRFRIDHKNQTFAVAGVLYCSLVLYGASGQKISDKIFKYLVDTSLEETEIVSENDRGALDQILELVPILEALETRVSANELLRVALYNQLLLLQSDLESLEIELATYPEDESIRKANELLRESLKTELNALKTELEGLQTTVETSLTTLNSKFSVIENKLSEMTNLISNLSNAEALRVTAELNRSEKETLRQQAETTRAGFYDGFNASLSALTTDVNAQLVEKANVADVYNKTQTYNKTETDASLSALTTDVNAQLVEKANVADVYNKTQTYNKTETDASLSAMATDVNAQLADIENNLVEHKLDYAEQISNVSRLITRYVYSGNIEAHCSAVNIDTDTFTSISHGFKNGEQIIPVLNPNAGAVYPMNVFVGGMSTARYYVINATTDTFQISTINNGSAVDLVTNATQDLTKWHFEKFATAVNITNLPPHKKYKFLIKGRQPNPIGYANNLAVNGIACGGGKAIKETGTTFGYGDNVFYANMFLNLEIIVDWTDILTFKITGYIVNSTALNSFSTSYINRLRAVPTQTNTDIISFSTGTWSVINGLVVEVYTI